MMRTGRVYKIVCGQSNECYVGSTFDELKYRFQTHKTKYRQHTSKCSVVELFDKYGIDNCKMLLIKQYEVIDRRHLEVYETLWIKKLNSINKVEPCGGLLEKQYQKQYRKKNEKVLKEYGKQWYRENREKIKQSYDEKIETIAEKSKERYEQKKEVILEQQRQYRERNKQKVKQRKEDYRSVRVNCECGSEVSKNHISKHKQTQKHQKYLETQ